MNSKNTLLILSLLLAFTFIGCGKKQEELPDPDQIPVPIKSTASSDIKEEIPFTLKTDEITLECGPYCANDFNIEDYVIAEDYSSLLLRISGNRPSHCEEEDFSHPDAIYEFREVIAKDAEYDVLFPEHIDYDPHLVIYDRNTGYFSTIRILTEDTTPPIVDVSFLNTTINLYGLGFIDNFDGSIYIATWKDGTKYYDQGSLSEEYICPNVYKSEETMDFVYDDYVDNGHIGSIFIYLETNKYVFRDPSYQLETITINNDIFPDFGTYTDNLIFEDRAGNKTKVPVTINVINDFDPQEYEHLNQLIEDTKEFYSSVSYPNPIEEYITAAQEYNAAHPDNHNELIANILSFAEEYQP